MAAPTVESVGEPVAWGVRSASVTHGLVNLGRGFPCYGTSLGDACEAVDEGLGDEVVALYTRSRSPGAELDRESWIRAIADAVVMGGLSTSQEASALAHVNGYCEPDNKPLPGWDDALYAKARAESADLYGSPGGEDEPDDLRPPPPKAPLASFEVRIPKRRVPTPEETEVDDG